MKALVMKIAFGSTGSLYPLADVLFQQQGHNLWSISSLDNTLNLMVSTGWRRYENLNLKI